MLSRISNISTDEKRVRFGMNIFHHDLETTEALSFGCLNLIGKMFNQVLIHNTIRSSKEGEDMGDEVTLVVIEMVGPVVEIF